jgi:hypothetical protein
MKDMQGILKNYEKGFIMDDNGLHPIFLPPRPQPIIIIEEAPAQTPPAQAKPTGTTQPDKPKIEEALKETTKLTKPPRYISQAEADCTVFAFLKAHPEASEERKRAFIDAVMQHVDTLRPKLLAALKLLSENKR